MILNFSSVSINTSFLANLYESVAVAVNFPSSILKLIPLSAGLLSFVAIAKPVLLIIDTKSAALISKKFKSSLKKR